MNETLTGSQRRFLRKLGHTLDVGLRIGRRGWHDGLREPFEEGLAAHELVKVRIQSEDREVLGREIAELTRAHFVGLVGHAALFYRPRAEEPRIVLPRSPSREERGEGSPDEEHLRRSDEGSEDRARELDEP